MNQVIEFFSKLFDTADWPPRWHCGKWSDFHGWLYIVSDFLIWGAYFAIPIIIIRFITLKKHQRFIKLYFLFAAFILACGATHFLDAISFWVPLYRLSALVRAITAVASWLTVFSLIKLLPYAFSLRPASMLEDEIEMRKNAEAALLQKNQQLEESRQTFKHAFDYAPIGIALVSPQGTWLNANQAVCAMLGYTAEELAQLTFQDITHPDDLEQDLAYVAQLLSQQKETYQIEKRYFTKSGGIVYALLSVSLVWKEEAPSFFISQIVDITAQKQLAMEIEKKNLALQDANAELQNNITQINEFNRIIGNNLRGPVSSLINAVDYIENTGNEDDKRLLFSKMKGTCQLILNTINDLKDFLEIQLNHGRIDVPVVFKDALRNSMLLLEDEIAKAQAAISIDFAEETVYYPKVYLESLFYNLISNALKYKEPNKPAQINITTRKQGDYIVLCIADNGIGIDIRKHKNEIFKYRKIFHKGYESNGVGLFLTKTQIEAFNGKIDVSSTVNQGTTFTIFLKGNN